MTPTIAPEDVLVERLHRYSKYVERALSGLTPPGATDLRVGPRMCVDAMIEAADAITTLIERERRLTEATGALVARIDRLAEGQCGPFAIRNSIANSPEMDKARAALTREGE